LVGHRTVYITIALLTEASYVTKQLSYRKEDRAMRPIYGCSEKFP